MAVLIIVESPNKWWFSLKSAVYGTSSSLPPLVSEGGRLVSESLVRLICCQIILTASSPCREAVDLPPTCHQSPCLTTFAFRSRGVRHLLLDLDPYFGTDPLGMFPLCLKRTADVMTPLS